MCTVTFTPHKQGYCLAMNRDERIARGIAIPPAAFEQNGVQTVYPRDIEGGTWIAGNGRGTAFTLLNWNDAPKIKAKSRTRGCVIPALIGSGSSRAAQAAICQLNLHGILPFTLVGFFPSEEVVSEWSWDQRQLRRKSRPWQMRQWCSSSLSDATALRKRKSVLQRALRESDAKAISWLRRLHASHLSEHDPFSICVHREQVETLSYTELICASHRLRCNYAPGSPCRSNRTFSYVSIARTPGELDPDATRQTQRHAETSFVAPVR